MLEKYSEETLTNISKDLAYSPNSRYTNIVYQSILSYVDNEATQFQGEVKNLPWALAAKGVLDDYDNLPAPVKQWLYLDLVVEGVMI